MSENVSRRPSHVLAILSGGLDSAVALALANDLLRPARIGAVHFEYGSTQVDPEYDAFHAICDHFDIRGPDRYVMSLPRIDGSSLTAGAQQVIGVPDTYVPNRNMIFIARAAAIAIANNYDVLCVGVHEEDAEYPDCSAAFIGTMKRALALGTNGAISLQAPVIKMTKAAIVKTGLKLKVPLGKTWTCYHPVHFEATGGPVDADMPEWLACGECDSCKLRLAAFNSLGVVDFAPYAG